MSSKKLLATILLPPLVILAGVLYFRFTPHPPFNIEKAFVASDCPVIQRTYLDSPSYKGPLIDTHIHIPPIPDGPNFEDLKGDSGRPTMGVNITIADYICMMDTEGTKSVFAFFPIWDPIREESIAIAKETVARYPGRFIPFIMPPDHDNDTNGFPTVTADTLSQMLSVSPKLFSGYGEIGLYARGDHGGPKGAPELPPDSNRLAEIYPVVRKNNLLIYFHLGQGQKESFEKTLSANPDINFIWHGDQLIPQNQDGTQNLKNIEEILSNHPNAYYGIDELYGDTWLLRPGVSKSKFLAHFKDYKPLLEKDLATWKGFIERHPNQVLWGTDRGSSPLWSIDPDVALVLNNYSRAFIGRLDLTMQEKFAYKNAERLLQTLPK